MERVEVEWLDSNAIHGWGISDGSDTELARCHTVGWLLLEDEEKVTVAQSTSTLGSVMNMLIIPKVAVVQMKILRLR